LQQLKIDFPDGPEIPRLSLKLDNPEDARLIIAAIIKVYFDEIIGRDKKDRLRRLKWLEELSQDAEKRLEAIKKTKKGFAQLVGAADPKNGALKQDIALKDRRRRTARGQQGQPGSSPRSAFLGPSCGSPSRFHQDKSRDPRDMAASC